MNYKPRSREEKAYISAYQEWHKTINGEHLKWPIVDPSYLEVNGFEQSNFQYIVLDHGFVVNSLCCLGDMFGGVLEGVEVGVVARTYASDADIAAVSEGLEVVFLPIHCEVGSRYILTFPKSDGAGTRDWLQATKRISATYRDCVLPLSMARHCELVIPQGGKGKVKLRCYMRPCRHCGGQMPALFVDTNESMICDKCGDEFTQKDGA